MAEFDEFGLLGFAPFHKAIDFWKISLQEMMLVKHQNRLSGLYLWLVIQWRLCQQRIRSLPEFVAVHPHFRAVKSNYRRVARIDVLFFDQCWQMKERTLPQGLGIGVRPIEFDQQIIARVNLTARLGQVDE